MFKVLDIEEKGKIHIESSKKKIYNVKKPPLPKINRKVILKNDNIEEKESNNK